MPFRVNGRIWVARSQTPGPDEKQKRRHRPARYRLRRRPIALCQATLCACYSMCMLTRRLQILLDEDRHRRLSEVAEERGVSVATVVREAIDRGLPNPASRRHEAGRRLLDAADMPVPEPEELMDELDRRGR